MAFLKVEVKVRRSAIAKFPGNASDDVREESDAFFRHGLKDASKYTAIIMAKVIVIHARFVASLRSSTSRAGEGPSWS